jgi:predicted pyridoxine 5'-phosphate oxidase superfamily flavin-nucleotide-binding protein
MADATTTIATTTGPFHPGELEAQQRAGGGAAGGAIRDWMPDQHRRFFETLPFVVVATRDDGWPVATLWTGAPGFVTTPDPRTLQIAVALDPGDPASRGFVAGAPFGLLGIELPTRRRNRANGTIAGVDGDVVTIAVRQSFGNCPQYIHPRTLASAASEPGRSERLAGIDGAAAAAIAAADTFFVATAARTAERTGGVDISHRGGPPGFVQIAGDTLTIPDYPGNRYFNTLGNLMTEPRAALVFVDFARGDLLHVQGAVEIVWSGPEVNAFDERSEEKGGGGPDGSAGGAGGSAPRGMPERAERLWRVHVERGWRRRGGFALHEQAG